MEVDGFEYEDEDEDDGFNMSDAAMDGEPKFQIFLKIIGVLVLIAAAVILVYFQWEQLQIARNAPKPNLTSSFYNSSCNGTLCNYELRNQLPDYVECFHKENKTNCDEITFNFNINGTKSCVDTTCKLETVEYIDKCSIDGWDIKCEEIEVKLIEE